MSDSSPKSRFLKNSLQFLVSFGVAFGIFWYLYGGNLPATIQRLSEVDYRWLSLSILLGIWGHWLRSYRWKLLLIPTGHNPSNWRALMALFLGYLANLALPRLGEVTRCLSLRKTDKIPVTISFGTVVTERLLDVLCLAVITLAAIFIEFEKLSEFFGKLFKEKLSGIEHLIVPLLLGSLGLMVLLVLIWWRFKDRIRKTFWWNKLRSGLRELWNGLSSISRVKQRWQLWGSTLLIWMVYFFMSYVVFFALDATSGLNWQAALSMLVMGGLAMSAPVQGGLGAYHYLVSALLIYYGVARNDGLFFAFVLHTSQTLLVIISGLVSLVLVFGIKKSAVKSPSSPS